MSEVTPGVTVGAGAGERVSAEAGATRPADVETTSAAAPTQTMRERHAIRARLPVNNEVPFLSLTSAL
ncbi:unannotated protein [freshwater metagenome]|uniref:Unannotated protein n=1 Tax=freshwater metagenome TaxID=449393 RepID=A0A6J7KCQ6_9ZZZZ